MTNYKKTLDSIAKANFQRYLKYEEAKAGETDSYFTEMFQQIEDEKTMKLEFDHRLIRERERFVVGYCK